MNCIELQPWLQAYLDGELPVDRTLEVETHLGSCEECRIKQRFWRALRTSLRRSVRAEAAIENDFRESLSDLFKQEIALEQGQPRPQALVHIPAKRQSNSVSERTTRRRSTGRLRYWAPRGLVGALAIAAAALLWLRLPATQSGGPVAAGQQAAQPVRAEIDRQAVAEAPVAPEGDGLVNDGLVDEFLNLHSMPPPPRGTEPGLLTRFERDVGVRVQLPPWATRQRVSLQSASVRRVRRGQVAFLRYRTRDDHHVTLYVYDPARIPLHAALPPKVISPVPVYQVRRRGYSIAAMARRGVGYAVASDLDSEENLELIGSLY